MDISTVVKLRNKEVIVPFDSEPGFHLILEAMHFLCIKIFYDQNHGATELSQEVAIDRVLAKSRWFVLCTRQPQLSEDTD